MSLKGLVDLKCIWPKKKKNIYTFPNSYEEFLKQFEHPKHNIQYDIKVGDEGYDSKDDYSIGNVEDKLLGKEAVAKEEGQVHVWAERSEVSSLHFGDIIQNVTLKT